MQVVKMIFAVICFGLAFLSGVGLFMSIYNPSPLYGNPLFWAPWAREYVTFQRSAGSKNLDSPVFKIVDQLRGACEGTSAEAGDDGQVGRGNRVNGLATQWGPT
jgi:hypothetical protein